MKNKPLLLAYFLIIAIITSCGGGGGGGGGAVAFQTSPSAHNGGDAGGWGKGNQTGNGFGGNGGGLGSSGDSNIIITGSTPLEVGRYNYNGASYDNVEALYAALAANTLEDVFYVDFQVEGESTPRKARVTANGRSNDGNDILIEHQYKAIFPGENGNEEVLFYKRDGIELPGGSGSEVIDGFEFEKGWEVDNRFCPPGTILSVASSGDVDLTGRAELKAALYGYKQATNDNNVPIPDSYILGFRESALTAGDTVTVTTDRKITKLKLPGCAVKLDLSGATNFKTVNLVDVNADSLQEIILPSNAETIAGEAFYGCTNLTSVTLPSTLTSIQYDAFRGCSSLTEIEIPAGVTSLADDTFNGCNALSSVTFAPGSQLTTIDMRVFQGCSSLNTITLPSTLTSIGQSAFSDCSHLASINIPLSVNSIGPNAFNSAGTNAANGFTITFEGNQTFTECHLPSTNYNVQLNGNVPKVVNAGGEESIFNSEDTLTSVIFYGCTELHSEDFSLCGALTTVTFKSYPSVTIEQGSLPNSVHKITFDPSNYNISIDSTVQNLFAVGYNYSNLEIDFINNSYMLIQSGAFDFTNAELISYVFTTNPNSYMTYYSGNCFKTGSSTICEGTTYFWNTSIGSWQ